MSLVWKLLKENTDALSRDSFEAPQHPEALLDADQGGYRELDANDLFIKDAFLVFRALCKLTMKPLSTERYLTLICFP